ncbi:Nucleolar MIF4G domain-containing protein 1 [Aphelenchoides fujianensis]|nr:Nucleolar MIF4G domain-containing protein 1 [Aphelenchoides fujianensis]
MDDRDFSHVLAFPKDRKGERKTKRKLKKVVEAGVEEAVKSTFDRRKKRKAADEPETKKKKKKKSKSLKAEEQKFRAEARKTNIERLREELANDEREIKHIMKKLGYNKRKSKSMPEIFEKEGLHLLWEACDNERRAESRKEEPMDDEEEPEEDEEALTEDIYGRLIDRRTGKVVKGVDTSKAQEKLEKLNEESELLNESTLVHSVKTMEQIFKSNSRNDVKQIFYEVYIKSVATPFALTDRLLIEYAAFLSLVHQLVSSEISAFFVEKFVLHYLELIEKPEEEGKALRNGAVLLAHVYNFKIVKASFLFEIMDKLTKHASASSLSMIGEIFTYAGIALRKRDGPLLNEFLLRVHRKVDELKAASKQDERLKFVLDDLATTKELQAGAKVIKGLTKHLEKKEAELGFTVDDLLHVNERGRWWVVGSAFARTAVENRQKTAENPDRPTKFDRSLLDLAKKLKMNTPLRQTIFCTIMTANGLDDAFEKLVKLNKTEHENRELIYILITCALNERVSNPFYCSLIERFCDFKRSFQLTTQYALWDQLKEVAEKKKHQRVNLANLIADLLHCGAVRLTVLKVINFAAFDSFVAVLLKRLFFRLLVRSSEAALRDIFGYVLRKNAANELLSQGLQLFFELNLKPEDFAEAEELPIFEKRLTFVRGLWGSRRLVISHSFYC